MPPAFQFKQHNRPLDLSLTTEDIDGARSRKKGFVTKRCTDPLDPLYALPTCTPPPAVMIPELIGGLPTNFTADIDGSAPRKLFRAMSQPRDPLDISDIEMSQNSKSSLRLRRISKRPSNSLDVADINLDGNRKLAFRGTNPLDPEYAISTKSMWNPTSGTGPIRIGPIEKARPKIVKSREPSPKVPVTGANPQRYVGQLRHSSVGPCSINIEAKPLPTASGSGTLKKGIVTNRSVNPLDPNYLLLDGNHDSACRLFM
jgi:hypothetical protein